ncbi:MAG: DUF4491 family protein [Paenibacillus sp.]|nr:DUF4491 family protein [Paenibacillus sp.]
MTELLSQHHILGLILGLCTFLIIGIFHPITIKCEYYFGDGCRWWFLVLGIIAVGGSICVVDPFWSSLLGVLAFSSFWTIGEIKEQTRRVERGWFPENPKRKKSKREIVED